MSWLFQEHILPCFLFSDPSHQCFFVAYIWIMQSSSSQWQLHKYCRGIAETVPLLCGLLYHPIIVIILLSPRQNTPSYGLTQGRAISTPRLTLLKWLNPPLHNEITMNSLNVFLGSKKRLHSRFIIQRLKGLWGLMRSLALCCAH